MSPNQYRSPFTNHNPNSAGIQFDVDGGSPGNFRLNPGGVFFGPASTEWTHLAMTFEGGTGVLYYNGEEATTATLSDSQRTFNLFAIGANRNRDNWMEGTVDELRVYDHPLTAEEIQTIMVSSAGRLPRARRPAPADGAIIEQTWANLGWGAGDGAVSHDLYFGTNFDDVNDSAEGSFVGNLAVATQVVGFAGFPAPDGLQPGTGIGTEPYHVAGVRWDLGLVEDHVEHGRRRIQSRIAEGRRSRCGALSTPRVGSLRLLA